MSIGAVCKKRLFRKFETIPKTILALMKSRLTNLAFSAVLRKAESVIDASLQT